MSDDITTVRAPRTKDRPYFSMSRASAQDTTLTWEARGVLAYLLSKPDDWQVMIKDLQQNCGRDKVRSILKELQDKFYLTVEQVHDSKGKFSRNQYRVFESPSPENPSTVEPSTANPPLTYKRGKQIIEKTISPDGGKSSKPIPEKKPRPVNKNAPWHDALLECFGLTPDTVTSTGDKTYWVAAADLARINFPVEKINDLHEWCVDQDWPNFTVMALAKHAGEWLADEDGDGDDPYANVFANLT